MSGVIKFYEGGVVSNSPISVVFVTRDPTRLAAYSVPITTGADLIDVNRVCLIQASFYLGSTPIGTPTASTSFYTTIDGKTGEADNSVAPDSIVRTVALTVPPLSVGKNVPLTVVASDATGAVVPVSLGSVLVSIQDGKDFATVVNGAGAAPFQLYGAKAGTSTVVAIVDDVYSNPVSVVVAP